MPKRTSDGETKDDTVIVPLAEANATVKEALKKCGWGEEAAAIQADIMVAAETCGNNQGLVKMYQPSLMAPAAGAAEPIVTKDTPQSAVIDGQQAPGMLALSMAVELAMVKAKGGIATVGVHNTSTSSGQLAYYGKKAADKGFIVVITANSPEFVAAKPGASATFGTNPLCFACPVKDSNSFVFDMSTAAIALFGVLTCKAKGEPLPEHSAYDASGAWTTAVSDIAIATFGGHKGVGLALMVELLCAALSGGAVLGEVEAKKTAKSWGHNVICIDPDVMHEGFAGRAASIIKTVAGSHPDGVRLPGQSSSETAVKNETAGTLPVARKVWEEICRTAKDGI